MGHSNDAVLSIEDVRGLDELQLATQHITLKAAIGELQLKLDAVNLELASRLEHPTEGSKTHKIANMKVKVSGRVYRRLDRAAWLAIRDNFNPSLRPVKDELDETAWKKLQKENPEVAERIAPAVVISQGKPGIEISF